MAQLPTREDLGRRPIAEGTGGPIASYRGDAVGRAFQNVSEAVDSVANQIQVNTDALARENAALAEARANNDLLAGKQDIDQRIKSGEFQSQEPINAAYSSLYNTVIEKYTPSVDPRYRERVKVALAGTSVRHQGEFQTALLSSQQDQQLANLADITDQKAKSAYLGGDLGELTKETDALFSAYKGKTGLDPLKYDEFRKKTLEDIYSNDISRRILGAGSSKDLEQVQADLSDPKKPYAQYIGPDKLVQKGFFVRNQLDELARAEKAAHDKAETAADRAIGEVNKSISSTVPPRQADLDNLGKIAEEGGRTAEFNRAVRTLNDVQSLVTLPSAKQDAYFAQEHERQQKEGATSDEVQRLNELETNVQKVGKAAQEFPIAFAKRYTTLPVGEVSLEKFSTPEGREELKTTFAQRATAYHSVANNYSSQVEPNLLLPDEQAVLKNEFTNAGADRQKELLTTLYTASGDPETYGMIANQVLKDDPTLAAAGAFFGRDQSRITEQGGWFSNQVSQSSDDVGSTILRGREVIKNKSAELPDDSWFAGKFDAYAGDAAQFIPPKFKKQLIDVAKAYALGTGTFTKGTLGFSEKDFNDAIKATTGEVTDYHGFNVILPWGMSGSDFQNKAEEAFKEQATAKGLPPELINSFDDLRLVTEGDGKYIVLKGVTPVMDLDLNGKPSTVGVVRNAKPPTGVESAPPNVDVLSTPEAKVLPSRAMIEELKLTPQEQNLYAMHVVNQTQYPPLIDKDGYRNTVLQTSQEHNGRFYNLPTAINGKRYTEDQARTYADKTGWDRWPSYATRQQAEDRYQKEMHPYFEGDEAALAKAIPAIEPTTPLKARRTEPGSTTLPTASGTSKDVFSRSNNAAKPTATQVVSASKVNSTGGLDRTKPVEAARPASVPRSFWNNNPGNIMQSGIDWQGKIEGDDAQLETFATPKDGVRAIASNLLAYQSQHGLNTVEDIIARWSPPSENDTPSLIRRAAKELGVDPNDAINLTDGDTLSKLTQAIIKQENGKQPYPNKLIKDSVAEALKNAGSTSSAEAKQ